MTTAMPSCLPRSAPPAPILVLGVGNILLRDEGIGVRVIEALQHVALPQEVELFDGATAGMDLLDALADRRKVIVIDAIDADVPPGTVLRLTPEDLRPQTTPAASLHELGPLEAWYAARQLGLAPKELVVLGVRPETVATGLELSATILAVLPRLVDEVIREIERSNDYDQGSGLV